jgi:hypothetical protein
MKPIYCMVILVSARVATAAAPTVVDFSSGKPADYFSADTADRVQVSTVGDTQAIAIANTTARLHDRTVKPSTKYEAVLNVNPSFQLGPYNYSGWQNISAGGKLIEREGKTILDTKYGSTGQKIPLPGPGTYAFSARATGNGYNSVVIVRVYDAQGKELMRSSTRRYGPLQYFVPPKNAAYASFLVYSCLLEEVRLLRVGDERAIESLQGGP